MNESRLVIIKQAHQSVLDKVMPANVSEETELEEAMADIGLSVFEGLRQSAVEC